MSQSIFREIEISKKPNETGWMDVDADVDVDVDGWMDGWMVGWMDM